MSNMVYDHLLYRYFIPFTRVLINLCGNHTHSFTKALMSLSMVVGAGFRAAIERQRTSHTCSIGLRSVDITGHFSRSISSDWSYSSTN
ncbi:hypothetical protein TNCV_3754061 [Trichonephila clavipes]|nr:hypothetical protein TNCV_3754061 [Trichonephila clavipes]